MLRRNLVEIGSMRVLLVLIVAVLVFVGLFVRTYTLPPAPDRRGGTTLMLASPNRPLFGSPRADCLATPEAAPVIPCLIASVSRARAAGLARFELPFCATCYDLSQRIAVLGLDEAAYQAKQAQIGRFGW